MAPARRVILIGHDPDTVDFSDPALLPGMNADKVRAGLALAYKQLADRGFEPDQCFTDARASGEAAFRVVADKLAGVAYDCVVIGAGIRLPAQYLPIFEHVLNAVHKYAPQASICFNSRPDDTAIAAARWLKD